MANNHWKVGDCPSQLLFCLGNRPTNPHNTRPSVVKLKEQYYLVHNLPPTSPQQVQHQGTCVAAQSPNMSPVVPNAFASSNMSPAVAIPPWTISDGETLTI